MAKKQVAVLLPAEVALHNPGGVRNPLPAPASAPWRGDQGLLRVGSPIPFAGASRAQDAVRMRSISPQQQRSRGGSPARSRSASPLMSGRRGAANAAGAGGNPSQAMPLPEDVVAVLRAPAGTPLQRVPPALRQSYSPVSRARRHVSWSDGRGGRLDSPARSRAELQVVPDNLSASQRLAVERHAAVEEKESKSQPPNYVQQPALLHDRRKAGGEFGLNSKSWKQELELKSRIPEVPLQEKDKAPKEPGTFLNAALPGVQGIQQSKANRDPDLEINGGGHGAGESVANPLGALSIVGAAGAAGKAGGSTGGRGQRSKSPSKSPIARKGSAEARPGSPSKRSSSPATGKKMMSADSTLGEDQKEGLPKGERRRLSNASSDKAEGHLDGERARLDAERAELARMRAQLERERELFESSKRQALGDSSPSDYGSTSKKAQMALEDEEEDSVVLINVGGETTIEVQRSTLRVFESSHLADLFTGSWERQLPRDSKGHIFMDCRADAFVPLVEFLRQCRLKRNLAMKATSNGEGKAAGGGRWKVALPTFDKAEQAEGFMRTLRYFGLERFVTGGYAGGSFASDDASAASTVTSEPVTTSARVADSPAVGQKGNKANSKASSGGRPVSPMPGRSTFPVGRNRASAGSGSTAARSQARQQWTPDRGGATPERRRGSLGAKARTTSPTTDGSQPTPPAKGREKGKRS